MIKPLMACGHRANATQNNKDVCVICAGITKGWDEIAEIQPDLTNRKCICAHCKKIIPSTKAIAFFEFRPNERLDQHYDGCLGWD